MDLNNDYELSRDIDEKEYLNGYKLMIMNYHVTSTKKNI